MTYKPLIEQCFQKNNQINEKNKKKSLTSFKVKPILRTILHQFGANDYAKIIANEPHTTE